MNTEKIHNNELFSKVLTQNATEEEQKKFESWLHESDENQADFNIHKRTWESADLLKEYDLENAKLKTQLKILEKLKATRGFFYYWQRVAAILIIPVLLISGYYIIRNVTTVVQPTVECVKTPFGARTSMILPDGSTIWLNAGSEVSYPHHFGKTREIALKGEAYLEVKKDSKPFIVKTAYGSVKVLGTKFNVFAFDNEPFRTTLVEGSVAINDIVNSKDVILEPGFQYVAEKGSNSLEKVTPEIYTSWKDGKMVFRRESFEQVARRLERWFNVTIELKGETIKNLWYTGSIEMESFSEVLELIKNSTPIDYSFNPQTRILTIIAKK